MKVLRTFLATAVVALAAVPGFAGQLSLDDISRYLNGISTLEAEFTQVNADQTISTGTIMIQRPGRARFEYNPPEQILVIAGGQQLAVFDGKSNTGPEQYPLRQTPLNLILGSNINLAQNGMVVGQSFDGMATVVTAQDPEHPEYGNIRLSFTADPVALRQWVITDGAGDETTVILGKTTEGKRYPTATFSINSEMVKRGG